MKILWINEKASFTGGCERYIHDVARLIRPQGFSSWLMYDHNDPSDPDFTTIFDGAFPIVNIDSQIAAIKPDLIYIHRLSNLNHLRSILKCGIPAVRFYHDHKLFCLREHKYFTIGNKTCTHRIGRRCYSCLGFFQRTPAWPGFRLVFLSALMEELKENRRLSAYIVGSQYMADHLALHGFNRSRIHRIPLFVVPPVSFTAEQRSDSILFAGQLIRGKGVDILLKAVSICREKKELILIGSGRMENEYRLMAENLGISSRVKFLGKKTATELQEYYRRCSFVVFPSRSPETFGLVGLEAMSAETPVIASAVGGYAEWMMPEETGIAVPSNDPAALAAAMDRLSADPQLRERFGKAGREHYLKNFQPENHIKTLCNLFNSNLR
ncbi:MAG: glycosyltransferase family 4 protein [Candidatus Riflebacteria bacterium]|nr:glycosyltransferase family 4 protein [Candidatus Riflebacteria bacterium]